MTMRSWTEGKEAEEEVCRRCEGSRDESSLCVSDVLLHRSFRKEAGKKRERMRGAALQQVI